MEKDPLTPLGRRRLNEVNARDIEFGEPGSIMPGKRYMLANPVEMGYVEIDRLIKLDPEVATDGSW